MFLIAVILWYNKFLFLLPDDGTWKLLGFALRATNCWEEQRRDKWVWIWGCSLTRLQRVSSFSGFVPQQLHRNRSDTSSVLLITCNLCTRNPWKLRVIWIPSLSPVGKLAPSESIIIPHVDSLPEASLCRISRAKGWSGRAAPAAAARPSPQHPVSSGENLAASPAGSLGTGDAVSSFNRGVSARGGTNCHVNLCSCAEGEHRCPKSFASLAFDHALPACCPVGCCRAELVSLN